jgi:tetratricopeptide (TPR) repeat protein
LKEYAEALADTDQALKLGDKDADLRVTRANILWLQGKKEAVAAEADALIRDNPSTTYPFVAAGKIYARAGRQADALKAFDRALAIRPEAYVYINRSQVRPESDVSGKMADLNQALKLDPDSEDALENKANLLSRQHDYSGAIALLARIKPVPGDTYPQQRTAVLMAKMGRTAEAQKTFETLRSSAKGAQDYNGLCWDKATAGIMLESALQDCREALKLKPDEGAYLDSLGMVLLKLGKLDDALAAYNRAVANGTGADSLMGRAFVYLKKGDRRHAEADAEAARKLAPDIDSIFDDYDLKFDEAGTASPAAGGAATRH